MRRLEFLEEIAAEGFDILPELVRIVVNEAMRMERQNHLAVAATLWLWLHFQE